MFEDALLPSLLSHQAQWMPCCRSRFRTASGKLTRREPGNRFLVHPHTDPAAERPDLLRPCNAGMGTAASQRGRKATTSASWTAAKAQVLYRLMMTQVTTLTVSLTPHLPS